MAGKHHFKAIFAGLITSAHGPGMNCPVAPYPHEDPIGRHVTADLRFTM